MPRDPAGHQQKPGGEKVRVELSKGRGWHPPSGRAVGKAARDAAGFGFAANEVPSANMRKAEHTGKRRAMRFMRLAGLCRRPVGVARQGGLALKADDNDGVRGNTPHHGLHG